MPTPKQRAGLSKRRPHGGYDALSAGELKALQEWRLSRRWAYRTLADEIALHAGVPFPAYTLRNALTNPGLQMYATSIYPMRKYLTGVVLARPAQAAS